MYHVAVYGFGKLGQAVCQAIRIAPDMQLKAVFSRRAAGLREDAAARISGVPFLEPEALEACCDGIDAVINCGSSAADLPKTTPHIAAGHCVVDSFDTHALIPAHFAAVDSAARAAGTLCIISAGWDPGLFSLMRILASAFLPQADISTFWGPGVSQGHSDALRRLPGVTAAVQYTVPDEPSLENARNGIPPSAETPGHRRICYVCTAPDTDRTVLERSIRSMPYYFAGYDTQIRFVSEETLLREHSGLPHGGSVICSSDAEELPRHALELKLSTGSNPDLTAGILTACARAAIRLHRAGECGCRTVADIPPSLYAPQDASSQRARWL